mgnify:CR=1 FL=1
MAGGLGKLVSEQNFGTKYCNAESYPCPRALGKVVSLVLTRSMFLTHGRRSWVSWCLSYLVKELYTNHTSKLYFLRKRDF